MENSLLVALSQQAALRRQMDVIANNIANMDTTAFKAERMLFAEFPVAEAGIGAVRDDSLTLVRDIATVRTEADGAARQTGNPLDVAIEGEGWLSVQTPEGERYTRNGQLRLDEQGRLVTDQGMPVLSNGGQPLFLSPLDTQITIATDGTLSSENGEIGRLRLVRFANPKDLREVEGGMFEAAAGVQPEPVDQPRLIQGALEGSNVEPILEMTRMIEVHRTYDRVKRMIDQENERIKKAVQDYSR